MLYLYGNYGGGDVFNFDLAGDMAELDGIETATVVGRDDVASQPRERAEDRRGVAGILFAYKGAGAAAERGDSLAQVAAAAEDMVANTATMGVGLTPTILPTTGKPSFELADDEMEIGIGIHGEPGIHRGKLEPADAIAEHILMPLIADLELESGDSVAVLVNGLGATPLEELYVLYRKVHQDLAAKGITIVKKYVGEYATSLEMAGASISLLKLNDERLALLNAPALSPSSGRRDMAYTGHELSGAIRRTLTEFTKSADELGELDQAIGDGDLGITVASGSTAAAAGLDELPETASPSEVVLACARAFANANPSTMAALVAGGLLAGSKTLRDLGVVGMEQVGPFVKAASESISARGKSQVGDKTILDAMFPAAEAFLSASPDQLDAAIKAAASGVESSTGLQSRRGRASWLQERSIGLQDPGATGFLRFLEAWKAANS